MVWDSIVFQSHEAHGLGSEIPQWRNLPSKSLSPANGPLHFIPAALGSRSLPLPSKSQSSIFPESWLLLWFFCPVSPSLPLPPNSSSIGGLHLHGRHRVRHTEEQKSLNSLKAAISGSSCFLAYAQLHDAPASFLFPTLQAAPQVSRAVPFFLCALTQSSLPGSPFTPQFSLSSLVPCLLFPPPPPPPPACSLFPCSDRSNFFFLHLWASFSSTFTLN